MATIGKPPSSLAKMFKADQKILTLYGSIEMGQAADWQKRVEEALADKDILILNPRRDNWDSSWEQSIKNPVFKEQVEWELNAGAFADILAFYFDPATKSPVTMMELGISATMDSCREDRYRIPIVVCCPNGFWRKGNIDIVCERFKLTLVETFEEMVDFLRKHT